MNITSSDKNSSLVLIVDDDRFMRMQLCILMEQEGYRVAEASNGEEALAVYHSHHPDIVLLDALMPVMDGFTCCSQLQSLAKSDRFPLNRDLPNHSDIPILMITTLEDEESVDRAFDAGATDYITKPINHPLLRQRVRRLLNASLATKQLQQHTERELLIGRIIERICQSLNLEEILKTTVAEVRQFLDCDRVLFYRVWSDGIGKVVSEQVAPGCTSIIGQEVTDVCFQESYLHLYREGRVRIISDVEQADIQSCHINFLQQFGVKANLVVPVLQGKDFWGLVIAHDCTSPRLWSSFDVELLQQLTSQVSIALAQAQHLEIIRESEQRFRQLAENIREVFFLATPDRMLYISPTYEEIWGRTSESVYKQLDSWFDFIYLEDCDRVLAAYRKQNQYGEAMDEEYRILRPNGSIRWIRVRTFPLRNEIGEIYRIPGIAEDITERKQAEEEIRQALQKEKELSDLKSHFVSMTSHEFRTPLSTILTSSELLEHYSSGWIEDKKQKHLSRIQVAVKDMTELLNDVLLLGKAADERLDFKPIPIDLITFCQNLVEEAQFSAGNKYAIAFVNQGTCANSCMDEKLLQHIFSNLLSNAIKYSPEGRKIQLELLCEQRKATFRVQDEGIGIPDYEQAQLFSPFERGSNVGMISGTGLGLAIVKRCVESHGGSIEVISKVGVGTTFVVTLPLYSQLEQLAISDYKTDVTTLRVI